MIGPTAFFHLSLEIWTSLMFAYLVDSTNLFLMSRMQILIQILIWITVCPSCKPGFPSWWNDTTSGPTAFFHFWPLSAQRSGPVWCLPTWEWASSCFWCPDFTSLNWNGYLNFSVCPSCKPGFPSWWNDTTSGPTAFFHFWPLSAQRSGPVWCLPTWEWASSCFWCQDFHRANGGLKKR